LYFENLILALSRRDKKIEKEKERCSKFIFKIKFNL
jgi:hypothetical protein